MANTKKNIVPVHKPPQNPSIDIKGLLNQLREALPQTGGQWRLVSLSAALPLPPRSSTGADPQKPEPDNKDKEPGSGTESVPVKPGAPKIEAVYEWQAA